MEKEMPFQGTGKGGARIESGQKSSRPFISNIQFYSLFISPLSYLLIPLISPFSTSDLSALFWFHLSRPQLCPLLPCFQKLTCKPLTYWLICSLLTFPSSVVTHLFSLLSQLNSPVPFHLYILNCPNFIC